MFTLLMALQTPAMADEAPTWPERAWLQTGTHQKLYDAPAKTEEELLRREGLYGLLVSWPSAKDDVEVSHYLLSRDGQQVLRVAAGEPTRFETDARGEPLWSVVAVDSTGQRSTPLESRSKHLDDFGALGLMSMGSMLTMSADYPVYESSLFDAHPGSTETLFDSITPAAGDGGPGLAAAGDGQASPIATGPRVRAELLAIRADGAEADDGVRTTLKRSANQLSYCVERYRTAAQGLPVEVELKLTADATGRVQSHTVEGLEPAVDACVDGRLRRLRFPESGSDLNVDVTLRFEAASP